MSKDDGEYLEKIFRCKYCSENHKVKLKKDMCEGRVKFPFPHVFLHDHIKDGILKELLTILYIDKDFQIRGVEIQELGDDNLFSKEQVISITQTLMNEIETLREENVNLTEQLNHIKKK